MISTDSNYIAILSSFRKSFDHTPRDYQLTGSQWGKICRIKQLSEKISIIQSEYDAIRTLYGDRWVYEATEPSSSLAYKPAILWG